VEPDYAPHTIATYEGHSRLYIVPGLGRNRLDKLSIRHVRAWLNEIRNTCQCCAQGKDFRRPAAKRRCCAIGACCQERLSERTVQDVLMVLRAALSNAVREELIFKNVAALVRVTKPRKNRKVKPWSVDEARHFPASRSPLSPHVSLADQLNFKEGFSLRRPPHNCAGGCVLLTARAAARHDTAG
jgi:hypothetical protein